MGMQRGERLALMTSGGDAPGMNAALRAAARVAATCGLEVVGFEDGYTGLLEGRVRPLDLTELDEAARRGGTVLGTARSKVFPTAEGQAQARAVLLRERVRALLVIGGNGSLTGARTLEGLALDGAPVLVAGLPASIDNDLACTSMSIGVDTAMNTIVEAVDRIFDTASSHRRTFFIEVMGRDCGYLAMTAGIASGADLILVREVGWSDEQIVQHVARVMDQAYASDSRKRRVLVVKSESVKMDLHVLKDAVDAHMKQVRPDVDTRITVLGHVVRGGAPSAFDRLMAARLANAAVRALHEGRSGFMAGWTGPGIEGERSTVDPYVVLTPLGVVLEETDKMMRGETMLARWRKQVYREVEPILAT